MWAQILHPLQHFELTPFSNQVEDSVTEYPPPLGREGETAPFELSVGLKGESSVVKKNFKSN